MLVFAPILSPQYVLWFLPFAAIVAARGNRLMGGLTLAVTALSAWSFAVIKAELHGQWYAIYPAVPAQRPAGGDAGRRPRAARPAGDEPPGALGGYSQPFRLNQV